MADDLGMTITELAQVLQPAVSEQQLRALIKAARIKPAGWRSSGTQGHPRAVFDYAEVAKLHEALVPWLSGSP